MSSTEPTTPGSSTTESSATAANGKVIVGMSGGVDSSVSALLLMQQGYEVEGLFMKNWDEDDGTEYCTAKEDLADAEAVCAKLGIKLHTANFAAEYWDNVFEHFLAEYKAGRTPNPDILCNREIKFKVFLEYAEMLGADKIATGHYVRKGHVSQGDGDVRPRLLKGLDSNKDQSYFLHAVPEAAIARTLFPVGELEKPAVRALAEQHDLITAKKKDSTGICFIGERRFRDFLQQYLPAQPGTIETPDGDVIGKHMGLMYYTLGQRQGLGIGGLANYSEDPWYVAAKDLDRNVLIAVQGKHDQLLYSDTLVTEAMDWVAGEPPVQQGRFTAKTRYRQSDCSCEMRALPDGGVEVTFDDPQWAVTPGQSLVLYDGDICLGGGVIRATWKKAAEAAA
ncbi:tRNA (5-methylaminomethyl-2-thiouridylate)-methyltransferase [Halomonas sp. 59]|jgi:tRNA-uridine 2-sulfurtransferase|nr:tRNA (5-methylaminomethyl-2-thiouridylate)-methyltransferase [Halomonas sp. 156]CAD5281471.1 tRNA (5-methylaminomethyl-2-thiouridylate)-methyltransferase [Halomonas sp. 113]CAD5282825.1 tRNA (5-methylaminomethyl-2-thiouridylate)-methyltransferase [Halomonas sp. 59]CAD5288996.1 tRNA (5-methylaminomethyl-2-thiouridylate)-methyltransferase [Halomonas sp. I3]VXB16038.1 tRNA (5-methylaminomethyl-2-thiouridylate)-methyltransferase [Halomonas titanicae]